MKREGVKRLLAGLCAGVIAGLMCGCSAVESVSHVMPEKTKEVKTVMTVGNEPVTEPEAYVYLYLMQKPYESCYGTGIWQSRRPDGENWKDWLLDEVHSQILEIEILSQRAGAAGMTLTDEAEEEVQQGVRTLMDALDEKTAAKYGITEASVTEVYGRSALAGLYYQSVLDGYDLQLSEEETAACEAICVRQIFIGAEDQTHLSGGQTQAQLAESLCKRAEEGEDFQTLAKAYSSENAQLEMIFDREGYVFDTDGWLEDDFVKEAWKLEAGAVSPVIQSSYGYHVLQCVAVNSDDLKAQAQEVRLREKKQAAFLTEYEKWLGDTAYTDEAWQQICVMEGI